MRNNLLTRIGKHWDNLDEWEQYALGLSFAALVIALFIVVLFPAP